MYRSPPAVPPSEFDGEPADDRPILIVGLLLGLIAAGVPVIVPLAYGEPFGTQATVALLFALLFAWGLLGPLASGVRSARRAFRLRRRARPDYPHP